MDLINFQNISFQYGKRKIFDQINLTIKKGSVNLFIGHNGSGKSTAVKLILGLLKVRRNNGELINKAQKMAYMPEKINFPEFLKVEEFLHDLQMLATRFCDYEQYLERFALKRNLSLASLSKGNKQKTGLCQLFMEDADLYVLDEPTNGLDQEAINTLLEIIKEKKDEEKTIIIVTHYPELYETLNVSKYYFNEGKLEYEIS